MRACACCGPASSGLAAWGTTIPGGSRGGRRCSGVGPARLRDRNDPRTPQRGPCVHPRASTARLRTQIPAKVTRARSSSQNGFRGGCGDPVASRLRRHRALGQSQLPLDAEGGSGGSRLLLAPLRDEPSVDRSGRQDLGLVRGGLVGNVGVLGEAHTLTILRAGLR